MKNRIEEYVQIDSVDWQPFRGTSQMEVFGGNFYTCLQSWVHGQRSLTMKISFASHIHVGPGEYLLTKGKMEVREKGDGGSTANALGYGYESCNAFQ